MKQWEVESNGVKHLIQYKTGLKKKIIVDDETHKVKSSNSFINVIDYGIKFGSTECNLVVVGNKADLAVNGTFLGSNKPYEPISNIPAFVWVLVGISVLGGFLLSGILSLVIGLLMSILYLQFGLQKNKSAIIGSFIGCTAFQVLIFFALLSIMK